MTAVNPATRVRKAFERIGAERMAGLPLLNAALEVEVIGFLEWGGMHLGVLITPWCLNLMALPTPDGDWRPPEEGVWRHERFPGMELQLLGGREDEVGFYAFRSLLSPVTGYTSQEAVRAVAREVLKQVLQPPQPVSQHEVEAARDGAGRHVSRRRLLGGA